MYAVPGGNVRFTTREHHLYTVPGWDICVS
jgi:hypothetical protein